jgi:hypothetical protein
MTKKSVKTKTNSMHGIKNCRVVEIGVGNFAECLKAGPATCSHALPFGYCFLCMRGQKNSSQMIKQTVPV